MIFFLMRNSHSILFYKWFDRNFDTFPLIQNGYFFKIAESDLLEITSYLIPNARIKIWNYLYNIFRKKLMVKLIFFHADKH